MQEDRNQSQIIRKDAKNCFVESLSDAFDKGKAHFAFATYDVNKPSGQRQTNNVHIYISMPELLELCRKLTCGELRYLWQERKKTGDNKPIQEWLGGTSAEKLRQYGKPRPDGKSLSRVCKLMAAQKFDFLFVADSGPGETDSKGLIVPRFGKNPENHVSVACSLVYVPDSFHSEPQATAGREGSGGSKNASETGTLTTVYFAGLHSNIVILNLMTSDRRSAMAA